MIRFLQEWAYDFYNSSPHHAFMLEAVVAFVGCPMIFFLVLYFTPGLEAPQ